MELSHKISKCGWRQEIYGTVKGHDKFSVIFRFNQCMAKNVNFKNVFVWNSMTRKNLENSGSRKSWKIMLCDEFSTLKELKRGKTGKNNNI